MACEYICDGCGKREPADKSLMGDWIKPRLWFRRCDLDGSQDACCRECIKKIAEKTGKTDLVLPI